ncbi:MAG TPA: NAD(P)-dependent oxidoreductase [Thermoanaerobaculia bacterium]|nr:NAD(P)-dependent oxidoreductase [Thermoanaerobaculia bacterium]
MNGVDGTANATARGGPARGGHPYYPVFLDLAGRRVVVVGGGEAAAGRVEKLREAGAHVTVIAPSLDDPDLARLAADGQVEHLARDFAPGDLEGARLVVTERLDRATAAAVYAEAERRGVFCCVEDDLDHLSYLHPSVVRRGALTVAISTAGAAPVLAVRLRQELEARLGSAHARFLELAAAVRRPLALRTPDFATRRRRWYRLIDSDVIELLAAGEEEAAVGRFVELLGVAPMGTQRPSGASPDASSLAGLERR